MFWCWRCRRNNLYLGADEPVDYPSGGLSSSWQEVAGIIVIPRTTSIIGGWLMLPTRQAGATSPGDHYYEPCVAMTPARACASWLATWPPSNNGGQHPNLSLSSPSSASCPGCRGWWRWEWLGWPRPHPAVKIQLKTTTKVKWSLVRSDFTDCWVYLDERCKLIFATIPASGAAAAFVIAAAAATAAGYQTHPAFQLLQQHKRPSSKQSGYLYLDRTKNWLHHDFIQTCFNTVAKAQESDRVGT